MTCQTPPNYPVDVTTEWRHFRRVETWDESCFREILDYISPLGNNHNNKSMGHRSSNPGEGWKVSAAHPTGPPGAEEEGLWEKRDLDGLPDATERLWKKTNGRYTADLWNHLEKIMSMKTKNKVSKKQKIGQSSIPGKTGSNIKKRVFY